MPARGKLEHAPLSTRCRCGTVYGAKRRRSSCTDMPLTVTCVAPPGPAVTVMTSPELAAPLAGAAKVSGGGLAGVGWRWARFGGDLPLGCLSAFWMSGLCVVRLDDSRLLFPPGLGGMNVAACVLA